MYYPYRRYSRPLRRLNTFKTTSIANYKPNVKQVRAIAKRAIRTEAEEKQFVSGSQIAYSITAVGNYQYSTPFLLFNPAQGTDGNQRIGQKITMKSLEITGMFYNDAAANQDIALQWFIAYLPYQTTSYTYNQIWEAGFGPDAVQPIDMHFTQVVGRVHTINLKVGTTGVAAQSAFSFKQIVRAVKWFQDSSGYSKNGKDLYFCSRVIFPQTATGPKGYLQVSFDQRYMDA